MPIKARPDGYHSVTPYLAIEGAAEAIDFYKRAFGATERMRLIAPDGRVGHAEIVIGDSALMLADPPPCQPLPQPAFDRRFVGRPACLPRRCRRCLRAGGRRRREGRAAGGKPVLRRPVLHARGPLRAPMVSRHAHRGCVAGGDRPARAGNVQAGRQLSRRRSAHGPGGVLAFLTKRIRARRLAFN